MPVSRATGHRLRSGLHIVANITSAYAITALSIASDQTLAITWGVAGTGTTPFAFARRSKNADGSESDDGFIRFTWGFSYLTFGQVAILDTAAGLSNSIAASDVSIMHYDATDTARYAQGKLLRPHFGYDNKAQRAIGGWSNVLYEFVSGVEIT